MADFHLTRLVMIHLLFQKINVKTSAKFSAKIQAKF